MNPPTVDYVLELIEQLPEGERVALEKRLSQRLDVAWKEAVEENRRIASQRAITDDVIQEAINRRRYGE